MIAQRSRGSSLPPPPPACQQTFCRRTAGKLRSTTKIGYGAAGFGDSALYGVFVTFFLYFMTDVAGVAPAAVGVLITIGAAWDAITDPLVGVISDSGTSRHGRRRPFMLLFAVPLGLSSWLIFTDFNLPPAWTHIYYLLMLLLYFTAYTLFYVPWTAFGAEITTDYNERSSVMSYKMGWAALGAVLGGAVPLLLADYFSDLLGSERAGWSAMAAGLGLIATVSILVSWSATQGYELTPGRTVEKKSWLRNLGEILRVISINRPFRYVTALFSFGVMAEALWASFLIYFAEYYMALTPEQVSFVWLVLFCASLPWLPLLNFTSQRFGKRLAYALFVGTQVLANLLILIFVKPDSFLLLCGLAALSAGGWAAVWTLGWAMISDVVEVDEFKTGERREGLYFGLIQFIQKLASGLILLAGGLVLTLIGYVPKAEQTMPALLGIRLTLCLGVALLLAASITIALLSPMTRKKHDALRQAIQQRKEGREYSSALFEDILS